MTMKTYKVKYPTVYLQGGLLSGGEGFNSLIGYRFDIVDYDIDDDDPKVCRCKAADDIHGHMTVVIDEHGKF
jgi:hypothetical protein